MLWILESIQESGWSPFVGSGTSIIHLVHVDDVVDLMMPIFQKTLDTWITYGLEDVYSNIYDAMNEAPEAESVAETYRELVFRMGKIASPTVKQVASEEAGKVAERVRWLW